MTVYAGGLRSRLIRDSLINMVTDSLAALGWFDGNRQHTKLTVVATAVPEEEDVPYNTLAFSDDDISSYDEEMGSNYSEHRWNWFIDFFAEDNSIGLHVIQDIKAILEGRFSSIGRTGSILKVYDYTLATPSHIFTCEIEGVATHRAHGFPRAYQRYWHSCSFDVLDFYGSDSDVS